MVMESNPYYITWLIFGLSGTTPKSTSGARTWMFVLLIMEAMGEYNLSKDPGNQLLYNGIPYTIKETVDMFKYAFPLLLLVVIMIFEYKNLQVVLVHMRQK
jgi:hypothetical protein